MALVLQDRVREVSSTTGTGTVTLSGAYDGYRTFASCVPDGSTVYYCIHNTATGYETEWEVGYGVYTAGTLSRDTIYDSSNSGSLVSFSAGSKEVFITQPADQAVYQETNGNLRLINGVIEVSVDGTSGTSLPNATFQAFATQNAYIQNNIQNLSDGSDASGDFVATNDQGDDATFYVDMGINSSNFSSLDYPIYTPNSAYVYSVGNEAGSASDLFVGSGDGDVVLHAGGWGTGNVVGTASATDQSMNFAADVNVGGALDVTGATTFGSTVTLHADPTLALQAATKQYVDNAASAGLTVHTPVRVESTGALTVTYNNGTAGVGATLTNAGTQTALVLDGVTLSVNDRVLCYDQVDQTQNGVYVVTDVGSDSTNWVMTRASDANTYGLNDPNALDEGAYFFVSEGNTGAYESYTCTTSGTITFGTTNITFAQFSSVPSYVANAPLELSGNTLSLSGTVAATNGGTGTNTVTTGDLLYGSATNTWSKLAAGSAYKSLVMNAGGTNVEWNAVALNQSGAVSGSLPATNGGTGQSTYTLGDTLYSSAANTLSKLSGNTTTTKKYLQQQGDGTNSAAPSWQQVAAADISGLAASATTDTTNAANISSGTLPSGRLSGSYTGITGVGTLTAGTWTASTVGVGYGGTGLTSYTTGDIVYASASGTLASLADVATGNALISGGVGVAPSYGKIGLTTHISGTLAVANGGTGATALTGYVYGNGTGAMTASTSIPNSATTATSANTASAIVARDASGNFTAGTITATLSGNASTATSATSATTATNATNVTLTTSATASAFKVPFANTTVSTTGNYGLLQDSAAEFTYNPSTNTLTVGTVSGALSGNATTSSSCSGNAATATALQTARTINGTSFNGTANITVTANTTNTLTLGSYLTGGSFNGSAAITAAVDATSANTASKVVARDASGNFSAGTITATLSGNASTASSAAAVSIHSSNEVNLGGSYAGGGTLYVNYNDGGSYTNLSFYNGGTSLAQVTASQFNGPLNGNASTATTLQTARTINGVSFNGSADITVADSTKLPLSGGTMTGVITTTQGNGNGINLSAAGSGYLFGTSGDGASSTVANVKLTSWFGIGFSPSISGQTVPQWENACWIDARIGSFSARNNITAYASDMRLKQNFAAISDPLDKVSRLGGYEFDWDTELCKSLGFAPTTAHEHGLKAQEVLDVMPDAVTLAPFDNDGNNVSKSGENYLTVRYERLVPLLIEAIKELRAEVKALKGE